MHEREQLKHPSFTSSGRAKKLFLLSNVRKSMLTCLQSVLSVKSESDNPAHRDHNLVRVYLSSLQGGRSPQETQ